MNDGGVGGALPLLARVIVAAGVALLLAVAVVRNAVVAQYAELRPAKALAAAPGNPRAELWAGLTSIASATRAGRPVDDATFASLLDVARKDPLAAAPFLVRGVQARLGGNEALAGEAFRAAERRDGRSVPARYFVADHDLRTGDVVHGLAEISVLSGMIPNGVHGLAPFVAAYARNPHSWPALQAVFHSNPKLGEATLRVLAAEPANVDLLLKLAPGQPSRQAMWPGQLVRALVSAGQYDKAQQVWRRLSGVARDTGTLIYDPGFSKPDAPGPFNWTLTSSSLGIAERQADGRLHLVYYGQDDGALAQQLIVLQPGRYRLSMQSIGDAGTPPALSWTVTCIGASTPLAKAALTPRVDLSFAVPDGCPAQTLELQASAPELPHTFDLTVRALSLTRTQPGA